MDEFLAALRAAHATGASAAVLMAVAEVYFVKMREAAVEAEAKIVERRRKDAARQELRRKAGPITYEMRLAVYDRDGWKCVYCGATESLTCVAIDRGGLTTLENLATACKPCNSRKQDRELKRFKRALARPDIRIIAIPARNPCR
jgi:5-methylcytosine-specific restriction endonuclease McrA